MTPHISRLIDAVTVEEVQLHLFEAMESFGFQNTLYAARYLLELPTAVFHEDLEILSNFPENFVTTLKLHKMMQGSCWAQWVLQNTGAITVEEITRLHGPDQLSDFAYDKGFFGGMVFSLKGKVLRSNGAIWLNPRQGATTAEAAKLWEKGSDDLKQVCWIAHLRMATIRRRRKHALLTVRQRQVLEWSAAGKTIAEIATILGVTAATVEKHLRLARESLGAGNTAQAILKAHLTNQIFTGDSPEKTTQ